MVRAFSPAQPGTFEPAVMCHFRVGEMWNSNSLIAWPLARSGHDTDAVRIPANGRAPGWSAGLIAAARQDARTAGKDTQAGRPHVPYLDVPDLAQPSRALR
jgi:hypothetical protein